MHFALPIATLLLTGANYYLITRWTLIFGGHINHKLSILVISILITLLALGMLMSQFLDGKFFSILSSLGSRIMMFILILTILTAILHLLSLIYKPNPYLILGLFVLIFAYGFYTAFATKITTITIATDKIAQDLNIMLVADLHVDDLLQTVHIKELKKQIELQKPDLVLIAGDFFNRANVRQAQYYEVLSGITTPMYAVEGNHDTMGEKEGVLALRHIQDLTNIQFLYNESLVLSDFNLQLIGIEEAGQRRDSTIDEVLGKSNIQDGPTFNILMTHQPISLTKLQNFPIDLEVAGHTHRGQFRGMHKIVDWVNDYGYGPYYHNDKIAFVSQGIGTRGLPFRLGTQSEIVIIHLKGK